MLDGDTLQKLLFTRDVGTSCCLLFVWKNVSIQYTKKYFPPLLHLDFIKQEINTYQTFYLAWPYTLRKLFKTTILEQDGGVSLRHHLSISFQPVHTHLGKFLFSQCIHTWENFFLAWRYTLRKLSFELGDTHLGKFFSAVHTHLGKSFQVGDAQVRNFFQLVNTYLGKLVLNSTYTLSKNFFSFEIHTWENFFLTSRQTLVKNIITFLIQMHLSKQSKNFNQDITTVKGVWIPDLHCTKTSNFVKILWGVSSLQLSCRYLDN